MQVDTSNIQNYILYSQLQSKEIINHETKTAKPSLKRKSNWDCKKGGAVEPSIPEKIKKLNESYVCLECLEGSFDGQFEAKMQVFAE